MGASKNPLVRMQHIRDEIRDISAALEGSDRRTFKQSYVLRRAAERALLIISEAVKALPADLLARYPAIDWPSVAALGNVLRHEYHMVDAETLWEILAGKLPELREVVERMLRDIGA